MASNRADAVMCLTPILLPISLGNDLRDKILYIRVPVSIDFLPKPYHLRISSYTSLDHIDTSLYMR